MMNRTAVRVIYNINGPKTFDMLLDEYDEENAMIEVFKGLSDHIATHVFGDVIMKERMVAQMNWR